MSRLSQKNNFSYRPVLVIALLLLVNSCFFYWQNATQSSTMDFFTFWAVPQCLSVKSVENIYSPDSQKELASEIWRQANSTNVSEKQKQITSFVLRFYNGRIDATGTPFMYTVIGLLSIGDFERDQMNFIICGSIFYILSIFILCRLLKFSLTSTLLIIIFFISWYEPLFSNLRVGNLNQIQLFIITIYLLVLTKSKCFSHVLLAGLVLGMGIMLKPNIILISILSIILTLINKEFTKSFGLLSGFCLGIIIALMGSFVYFDGFKIWIYFIKSLPSTLNFSYPLEHGNYSLTNLIFNLSNKDISIIIMTILIAIFSFLNWKTKHKGLSHCEDSKSLQKHDEKVLQETFTATGIGCSIMLVSAGLTWGHYYILLIPLALFMIRPMQENDQQNLPLIFFKVLSFIALLLFTPIMSSTNPLYNCIRINIASVMLIVLAFCDIWYKRMKI